MSKTYEPVTPHTVAFLGLGVMGYPMAGHLARAGHHVTVYNRTAAKAQAWAQQHGGASQPTPREAVAGADIVVTASRSTTPLFSGDELKPGCFVAAIGSSLPHTRELDDRALERAARIAVEWLPQTLREAGDLVLARPGLVSPEKLVELGALVTGAAPGRQSDDEITLYKSVGVGLEDVALAGLAWQRVQAGA